MVREREHDPIFADAIKYLFLCGILMLAIFIKDISLAMGLLLGGLASLLNYKILIYSTERLFDGNAYFHLFYSFFYLLRLLITASVILSAVKLGSFNLITAVIGLMWVRLSIVVKALKAR